MKTPIVEFLTPDKGNGKSENEGKEYTAEELFDISMSNVINNASWGLSDVLIGSPLTMAHVLKDRSQYAPFDINPRVIVIDECDLLLDSELEKKVVEIVHKFATKIGPFAEENKKRQFVFSCSTLT